MGKPCILVACWTGAATSTILFSRLRQFLASRNLDVEIVKCTVAEIEYYTKSNRPVMVLCTTKVPENVTGTVPVVDAMPLLTGMGDAEILDKVAKNVERSQT